MRRASTIPHDIGVRLWRPYARSVRWTPRGADEGRHDDAGGIESWSFELVGTRARGTIRLTIDALRRRAAFLTDLEVDGVGRLVVADESVPVPRAAAGLEIRADALWASLHCEIPFVHWTLGLEAFGLRVDAGELDEVERGTNGWEALTGERLPVGFDLEWEVGDDPVPVADGIGYRQRGDVHGEVLVMRERVPVDGPATREHWWGGRLGVSTLRG